MNRIESKESQDAGDEGDSRKQAIPSNPFILAKSVFG
jgi:hypothetical protein